MLIQTQSLRTRLIAFFALIVILTIASARLRADTGTCGGQAITLPFTDVPASNIFFCSIASAYFSGLTNGTGAGTTYSPGANVTREQMAAFVTRTLDQSLRRGSQRAALGKWWVSDHRTYGMAGAPGGIKSDGEDLWVACNGDGTVKRVRQSDGRILETWTGATAANQVLIAAGYIYVTGDTSPGSLYRIDPTTAPGPVTTIQSALPNSPMGIAYDGERLWIANYSGSVSIVLFEGTIVSTVTTGFFTPRGVIFDGANIWVTDEGDGTIKKLNFSGAIIQTVSTGIDPFYPVFDGTNIWVPNFTPDTVTVVRASSGAVLATLSSNGLDGPYQGAFDGERVLFANVNGLALPMWKASDLSVIANPFGAPGQKSGVCSDGVNFWAAIFDQNLLLRY
jgi:hypothetical protein